LRPVHPTWRLLSPAAILLPLAVALSVAFGHQRVDDSAARPTDRGTQRATPPLLSAHPDAATVADLRLVRRMSRLQARTVARTVARCIRGHPPATTARAAGAFRACVFRPLAAAGAARAVKD
jgi:hypothetical protein